MLKLIVLTSLLFCFNAHAYPYKDYSPEKTKLNKENFRRYVRPQLKSIVRDYYLLLGHLHPIEKSLIRLRKKILTINFEWKKAYSNCPTLIADCNKTYSNLYALSRSIDEHLLKILKEKHKFPKNFKQVQIDAQLKFTNIINKIHDSNYQLLHSLEEILLVSDTFYRFPIRRSNHLSSLLHQMLLNSESSLVLQLDDAMKSEFEALWTHFIKKIEAYVVLAGNQSYLTQRLGEFNMSWNSFHMKVTKGNIKLPKRARHLVQMIHNRWNSILKIILG